MSLSEAIKIINAAADSPGDVSEKERKEALSACERLRVSLETPVEHALRLSASIQQAVALRLGVDMKLFDAAAKAASDRGEVQIEALASEASADPLLVTRIMRILVGMGIFKQVAKGSFVSTSRAGAYITGSPVASGVVHITQVMQNLIGLPDFFEKTGFKSPDDAYNGPFQYAKRTDLHFFDYLATKPKIQQAFNAMMKLNDRKPGLQWFEYFPVETKLRVESPSTPLLIDVAGGLGHDLVAFKQKFPNMPGKFILQDLPVVIDNAKDLPEGIEAMGHNMFVPQPVKGAKAYFMRMVLHDWPDDQARQILRGFKDAMTPESLLLICETVLPETNVALVSAQMDLIMMANFAALERTEKQFETLLDEAGFELVRVWRPDNIMSSHGQLVEQSALIEAVLKKQ
ncbi:hypothetical protein MMC07_002510 [Pseudocyphellaria aurata]|nr:hypothetical protein [Pseudocyphellaria aurata]